MAWGGLVKRKVCPMGGKPIHSSWGWGMGPDSHSLTRNSHLLRKSHLGSEPRVLDETHRHLRGLSRKSTLASARQLSRFDQIGQGERGPASGDQLLPRPQV